MGPADHLFVGEDEVFGPLLLRHLGGFGGADVVDAFEHDEPRHPLWANTARSSLASALEPRPSWRTRLPPAAWLSTARSEVAG